MYPQFDVNNVPLPDIVGPKSFFWYTWSTDINDERGNNLAKRPARRSNVKNWGFDAEERLSESGAPRFDVTSINAHRTHSVIRQNYSVTN